MQDRLVVLNKDSETMSVLDPGTGDTEHVAETQYLTYGNAAT